MGLVVLVAWPALAHRPYEWPVGTFEREDGTAILIVRHYVDGIFVADPVSIQFRLPNGTNVAQTPHMSDALVRTVPSAVEVYQFASTWVPIADRVDRFDGRELHNITTERRLTSLFIHLAGHWIAYVAIAGVVVFFAGISFALRAIPKRGWRLALRSIGFGLVAFAGSLCAYDILVFEPVSPLIVVFLAAGAMAVLQLVRRKRHATVS